MGGYQGHPYGLHHPTTGRPAMADEYTPTVDEVRRQWNNAVRSDLVLARSAEFDRMIAAVERAAAVKELRDVADQLREEEYDPDDQLWEPTSGTFVHPSAWLDARADRIESGE